jgi:hypothetical protein
MYRAAGFFANALFAPALVVDQNLILRQDLEDLGLEQVALVPRQHRVAHTKLVHGRKRRHFQKRTKGHWTKGRPQLHSVPIRANSGVVTANILSCSVNPQQKTNRTCRYNME